MRHIHGVYECRMQGRICSVHREIEMNLSCVVFQLKASVLAHFHSADNDIKTKEGVFNICPQKHNNHGIVT